MLTIDRTIRLAICALMAVVILSACGRAPVIDGSEILVSPGTDILLNEQATLQINVTVQGASPQFHWTAERGTLSNPSAPSVIYTAPDTAGPDIVTVVVTADQTTFTRTTTFNVVDLPTPTATEPPTPENTLTPTPAFTSTPPPPQWACTSYRAAKLQTADIPGQVTIDTPAQGTSDIQSGQSVQVAGTYTGIPEGNYLWVFIYSDKAGLHGRYYPQSKDAVKGWQPEPTTGQDGLWTVDVGFGAPDLCYEVIVLVADAEANQSIVDQLKAWADLNKYAGYELNGPETAIPPDAPGFPEGLVEKASIEVRTR